MRQKSALDLITYYQTLLVGFVLLVISLPVNAQILFAEDCFVGGVTTGGANSLNSVFDSTCEIKWEDDYTLRAAYAITYRYGRPDDFTISINDTPVTWSPQNQIGPEQIETNSESDFFACHIENITNSLVIESNILTIDLPPQPDYEDGGANWGYWSVHIVILYESPTLNDPVCVRIYTADQTQDQVTGQNYQYEKPLAMDDTPVLFSIHADRLSEFESDRSRVLINNESIGDIWTDDLFPLAETGVQGTFYYENSMCEGLNGDTANFVINRHDGIAIINSYENNDPMQGISFLRVESAPFAGINPHPAFTITYTPECPIFEVDDIPRTYRYCRGASITLQANGYENYAWTPAEGLSDTTISNPICSADSSGWYQVRMWNPSTGSGTSCSQTIPVHVEVTDIPQPENVLVSPSICPQFTGQVIAQNVPGALPTVFTLNGQSQNNGSFTELEAGTYDLNITTADGCQWDTTVVVDMTPIHNAAFEANPESGYTPLDVFFNNESTANSTGFQWMVDGVPISTQDDFYESFDEAGSYQIELIAYRGETFCADTASFILLVEEGLTLVIPNIITPNGDGLNDALLAQSSGVAYARWEVLNRWGNLLYSSEATSPNSPINLWAPEKGEYPSGVYTVILTARGNSGQQKSFTVMVTVK